MEALGLLCKRALFASAAGLLLLGGFAFGFVSCLHLRNVTSTEAQTRQLLVTGDAPPKVREGVLTSLRAFQEGYVKRDSNNLESFMSRLFAKDGDVLMLGTEGGASEWVRGNSATAQFIQSDWQGWGDFTFNVDDCVIWSSGDVAWVASVGKVSTKTSVRPVRFTAILMREGSRWVFRQLQFQWDDKEPGATDILRPKTYLQLVQLALRKVTLYEGQMHP